MRQALAFACVAALAGSAVAAEDPELARASVVFVRGDRLIKSDGKGRNETEIATLATKAPVRALRTDALGKVLLADVAGTWWWMPLDGSARTLTELPCDAGPAQLSEDGRYVLCRGKAGKGSLVVNLVTGKLTPLAVPTLGARLLGNTGDQRKLVWADKGAIWAATAPRLDKPVQVAKEAPLRNLLPAPDGTHAIGTYQGVVFESPKVKKTAEVLMLFSLDGVGARRKAIQNGVPIEWSLDGKWVLVQDGAKACIMLVLGGQYKCWRGYTGVSISPDGRYALLLGNRSKDDDKALDRKSSKKDKKSNKTERNRKDKKDKKDKKDRKREKQPEPEPVVDELGGEAEGDEHGDAPMPNDDVAVPPPSGLLSLYRAHNEGAFTKGPALIARVVEGAAVWVPARAP
jgi:hypothetical protein